MEFGVGKPHSGRMGIAFGSSLGVRALTAATAVLGCVLQLVTGIALPLGVDVVSGCGCLGALLGAVVRIIAWWLDCLSLSLLCVTIYTWCSRRRQWPISDSWVKQRGITILGRADGCDCSLCLSSGALFCVVSLTLFPQIFFIVINLSPWSSTTGDL